MSHVSQSPRMVFEAMDARASQTKPPPNSGGTFHDLNISGSCKTKVVLTGQNYNQLHLPSGV